MVRRIKHWTSETIIKHLSLAIATEKVTSKNYYFLYVTFLHNLELSKSTTISWVLLEFFLCLWRLLLVQKGMYEVVRKSGHIDYL